MKANMAATIKTVQEAFPAGMLALVVSFRKAI